MRKRKVICRKCRKELFNTEAYQVIEGTKKLFFCNEEEYKEIQTEKEQYNSCIESISKVTNTRFVPPIMIKKVNEIRQFYDYSVIERAFKECQSIIQWSMENRDFNNEFAKTKYIISIVANNIAKVDKKIKQEKKEMERLFTKNNNVEVEMMNISIEREIKTKEVSDISMFLD